MNDPNSILWSIPNDLGWWFWLPFIGYGVYGLNKIYRLSPAESILGRVIRVLLTMGLLCLVFTPVFNGLGPFAFHLISISACLILKQVYESCLAAGKIKPPESDTVMGRIVERITAPEPSRVNLWTSLFGRRSAQFTPEDRQEISRRVPH